MRHHVARPPYVQALPMIAIGKRDHIHSRRPDGGPDRCHGRPPCDPLLPALVSFLDAEPFSLERVREVAERMRAAHTSFDWDEYFRYERQRVADELGRCLGLEEQGLYLSWRDTAFPIMLEE